MLGEGGTPLSKLLEAIREFQAREDRRVDLKGLRAVIDGLNDELAFEIRASLAHPGRPAESNERDRS
jgi:hypothetical protein